MNPIPKVSSAPQPFSDEEYAGRLSRLKNACEPLGIEAVLVQGSRTWYRDYGIRYLSGYDSPTADSMLFVPLSADQPILVIGDGWDLERARAISWAGEVLVEEDLASATRTLLSKYFKLGKRLGIAGGENMGFKSMDVLPRDILAAIHEAAPSAEVVDAGSALQAARIIRSPAEIELLRDVSRIGDIGAKAFFATARAGVTERDVWSEVWYAMQTAGADDLHISMTRGPGSFWAHPPSDDVIVPGDIVAAEFAPRLHGYFCQANRMCFVGDEGREWQDLERLAIGCLDAAKAVAKPGVKAKEVVAAVNGVVSKSPLATMDIGGVHRIGHGSGVSLDEGPVLSSSSESLLQLNMTMAFHPIVYLPYRHSMLILGDYVRITETGVESLTEPQRAVPIV